VRYERAVKKKEHKLATGRSSRWELLPGLVVLIKAGTECVEGVEDSSRLFQVQWVMPAA
jgi:hypothetical protein